jgi:hypothetical protein
MLGLMLRDGLINVIDLLLISQGSAHIEDKALFGKEADKVLNSDGLIYMGLKEALTGLGNFRADALEQFLKVLLVHFEDFITEFKEFL